MTQPSRTSGESWPEEETGPLVRLYAMTKGRTRHARAGLDLMAIITAAGAAPDKRARLGPEHEAILRVCQRPRSVAEISTDLDIPLGVLRVLLGDLLDRTLIVVSKPTAVTEVPGEQVLREVIDRIRAL